MSPTTLIEQRSLPRIAKRTRGQKHGPITRLMSPSDFGQLLKPFVFLDLIDNQCTPFSGFGLHPHSGIATVTYIAEGSVRYQDPNGATGLLPAGGIEWMRAGGGVWHVWWHRRIGTNARLPTLDRLADRTRAETLGEPTICHRRSFPTMGRRVSSSAATEARPVRSKLRRR